MNLSDPKDFRVDIYILLKALQNQENFAFSRFSDGEMMMLFNQSYELTEVSQQDLKQFDTKDSRDQFGRQCLLEAYNHQQPNYFIGLSCPCCVGVDNSNKMKQWANRPDNQLTWSNLLMNGNYFYFLTYFVQMFQQRKTILVCHEAADTQQLPFPIDRRFGTTNNAMRNNLDLIQELDDYISYDDKKDRIFLFSCGPLGNILIHKLSQKYPNNTYMDIGSTMNPFLNMPVNRGYLESSLKHLKVKLSQSQIDSIKCLDNQMNQKMCIW